MGSITSGNHGGRPTVEDGLTLNLAKLLRDRLFRPGQSWGGSLVWTNTRTGERVGSIGYHPGLLGRSRYPSAGNGKRRSRITEVVPHLPS